MTTVNKADLPPTGGPVDDDVAALAANAGVSDDELLELGLLDKVKAARGETSPPAAAEAPSGEPAKPAEGEAGAAGPAAAPTPAREEVDEPAAGPLIPKGRFDQVNDRRKAAETETQRLREELAARDRELEGYRAGKQPASPARPAAQEQVDPLAIIKQAKGVLMKAYNDGEIDLLEYETKREELEDQRLELLLSANRLDPSTLVQTVDYQRKSDELSTANGWYTGLTPHAQRMLKDEALDRLDEEGLVAAGPDRDYRYRELIVEIGKGYGFDQRAGAAPAAKPGGNPATTAQPPARTQAQTAADNAREKLELAGRQPLDLHGAPTPTGPAAIDLQGVAKINRNDWMALPKATRERIYAEAGVE